MAELKQPTDGYRSFLLSSLVSFQRSKHGFSVQFLNASACLSRAPNVRRLEVIIRQAYSERHHQPI